MSGSTTIYIRSRDPCIDGRTYGYHSDRKDLENVTARYGKIDEKVGLFTGRRMEEGGRKHEALTDRRSVWSWSGNIALTSGRGLNHYGNRVSYELAAEEPNWYLLKNRRRLLRT